MFSRCSFAPAVAEKAFKSTLPLEGVSLRLKPFRLPQGRPRSVRGPGGCSFLFFFLPPLFFFPSPLSSCFSPSSLLLLPSPSSLSSFSLFACARTTNKQTQHTRHTKHTHKHKQDTQTPANQPTNQPTNQASKLSPSAACFGRHLYRGLHKIAVSEKPEAKH